MSLRKTFFVSAIAASGLTLAAPVAAKEFVYGSWVSPKHGVNAAGLEPMFKAVEKETNGAVKWRNLAGGQVVSARSTLAGRIVDCGSKFVITADEGLRGGRPVPLKGNADAALKSCKGDEKVLVVRRTGGAVEMQDGRVAADSYHLVEHAYPWSLWIQGDVEPVAINGWVELPLGVFRLVATFNNPRKSINADLTRDLNVAVSRAATGSP